MDDPGQVEGAGARNIAPAVENYLGDVGNLGRRGFAKQERRVAPRRLADSAGAPLYRPDAISNRACGRVDHLRALIAVVKDEVDGHGSNPGGLDREAASAAGRDRVGAGERLLQDGSMLVND